MSVETELKTVADFDAWLNKNAELVLAYAKENDVPIRDWPISPRVYNTMLLNGVEYVSQMLLHIPESIADDPAVRTTARILRRDYLRMHRRSLLDYVAAHTVEAKAVATNEESAHKEKNCPQDRAAQIPLVRRWLRHPAKKAKVVAFLSDKNRQLREQDLSARSYNGLTGAGITDVLTGIQRYPNGFDNICGVGPKSAKEIRRFVEQYVLQYVEQLYPIIKGQSVEPEARMGQETNIASENHVAKAMPSIPGKRERILQLLKEEKIPLLKLGLSVRSYNALRRAGVKDAYEAMALYPDGFAQMRNLGKKSVDEICRVLEGLAEQVEKQNATDENKNMTADQENARQLQSVTDGAKNTAESYSLLELLEHPAFRERTVCCLRKIDIPIEEMGFGVRAKGALQRDGRKTFSQILPIYPHGISALSNIGVKTVAEIQERVEYYLEKLQPIVVAYCDGDDSRLYSDEYITEKIMSCFEDTGFSGLSFQKIRLAFSEHISDERIKNCIGRLIATNKLEYVDLLCYRVYPSVFEVLQTSFLSEEDKAILQKRFAGATLEAIAVEKGVGRERIRQIVNKKIAKLRAYLMNAYGVRFFDEDFYTYLYENYEIEKELWFQYLCVPEKTFGYLTNVYTKGKGKLEKALSDPEVNLILKFKIREYLNRNKIMIDGILIENQRSAIENYALSKLAQDEMSYDEFADHYNSLLRDNGIRYNEKLYYTEEVRRSRSNRLASSMCCLWKQGERLRFYNIGAQDYTELLETLNLEGFQNVEISTLKFFNDYPSVMEKYDIRDQYELHNLLKKIVDPKAYHDISFNRQPMIRFGEFDREKAIYEIIEAFSPITVEELAEYVHSEFGYDKGTAWNYFQPLLSYYHQGVFSVNFKRIPDDRVAALKDGLREEFYYISEIKEIYAQLFPYADVDEINHRSLKQLEFTVLEKYALRGYNTADEFFTSVLLREDVFFSTVLNRKYGNIQMYRQTMYDLRNNFDIVQFDDNQYINFSRLAKLGITKADLQMYIDAVCDHVQNNTYFTVHSVQDEVATKLDDLGFGTPFYAGLLTASGKFAHTYCFGTPLFYKGQLSGSISIKGFLLDALKKYDSIDLDDFIADCYDQYGVRIPARNEVTGVLSGTDFYYDNIMDKIYRDKSYYYAEFDE